MAFAFGLTRLVWAFAGSAQRIAAVIANSISRRRPETDSTAVIPGLAAVVAELERNAEVVLAQQADRLLEVVFRRGRHAHLVRLDGRLDLFQLPVLEELDDVSGGFGWYALLQRDDAPDRVIGGALDLARREVLRRHAAADQPALQDLPQRVHLEVV